MIIFLLASTYIQNSILDYLSLILGFNIESVLILKENYYDFRINKFELYELTVVDTIKDGIARSDITITIPYEIPQTTIDEADGMCKQFRKKFTLLPIEKIYNNVPHQFLTVNAHYSNIYISKNPIILILQLGNFAQITKFQLSINKFFSDKGYNFGQIFSSEFLSAVTDEDSMENVILNKIESLRLSELETDFSIITWPFDIFTSI